MAKAYHFCSQCGQNVEYDDEKEDLYEVAIRHLGDCKPSVKAPYGNLIDKLPDDAKRSDLITMEEILGQPILVKGFTYRDSTFKEDTEYLSLEIEVNGENKILNTGAERVVHAFKYVLSEQLPAYVTFEKIATKAGRKVYRIVGTT